MMFTEPNMMNPQVALIKNVPSLKSRAGDSPDETAFSGGKSPKNFEFTILWMSP